MLFLSVLSASWKLQKKGDIIIEVITMMDMTYQVRIMMII